MLVLESDGARLRDDAEPAAVARMMKYRRTGSSPGMPRWYVEDWRSRMTARRYVEPAYSPLRYITRLSNETHRAHVFSMFAPPRNVTMDRYLAAWEKVNGYVPGGYTMAAAA